MFYGGSALSFQQRKSSCGGTQDRIDISMSMENSHYKYHGSFCPCIFLKAVSISFFPFWTTSKVNQLLWLRWFIILYYPIFFLLYSDSIFSIWTDRVDQRWFSTFSTDKYVFDTWWRYSKAQHLWPIQFGLHEKYMSTWLFSSEEYCCSWEVRYTHTLGWEFTIAPSFENLLLLHLLYQK